MVKTPTSAKKRQSFIRLGLLLGILILLNIIGTLAYTRFDLTREGRFTLSKSTKTLLSSLEDVIYVKVYLEGDFPPGFQKLQQGLRDQLTEMRRYAGGNLEFEFINPADAGDERTTNELYQQLYTAGLQPTDLQSRNDDGVQRKIIWPGAMIYYRNKEVAMNFLLGAGAGNSPLEIINASEEALEYTIANSIKKATTLIKPRLAFTEGNGELDKVATSDIARSLSEFYSLVRYDLGTIEAVPADINLLIIAKPTEKFSDWDKYKIDHFVNRGGRILWLLDAVSAEMDSMGPDNFFMAESRSLEIEDLLFKYGVRVNPFLVQDTRATQIPIVYGSSGGQPQQRLYPWFYFPLVQADSDHPIVRKLDPIQFRFANSIDLVRATGVRSSVLLHSSALSRVVYAPFRVNLTLATEPSKEDMYNKGGQPLAVLLEGAFPNLYKSRYFNEFAQRAVDSLQMNLSDQPKTSRMIVVADGDVIRNNVRQSTGEVYPLGFDRFTNQMYGNKTFLLNAVDYLLDETGLINVRSKQITLRMLDQKKIKAEKLRWQLLNTAVPILLLLAFGLLGGYWRQRKYAKRST
jgi:ABC-2 type transport system permease protein